MIKSLSLICTMGGKCLQREFLDASFLSRNKARWPPLNLGQTLPGGRRQKRRLNPVGLRGTSSPLLRESLIDTWGLAWRAEDNASIVFTVFWIKTSVSRGVFAGGLARLQTSTFSFSFDFFSPGTVRLCLWRWNTRWSTSAFHNTLGI